MNNFRRRSSKKPGIIVNPDTVYVMSLYILLDCTSNATTKSDLNYTAYSGVPITDETTITKPSWVNVTYDGDTVTVTSNSANNSSNIRIDNLVINLEGLLECTFIVIQLPSNYHNKQYVTINGVNWGIKNVGALSIGDGGNYYQYGKGSATWSSSQKAYSGVENPLDSSVDTATQVLGSGWRMPTYNECNSLKNNAVYGTAMYGDMRGTLFMDSTNNNNLMFVPWGGGYMKTDGTINSERCMLWTSTPYTTNTTTLAFVFHFYNEIGTNIYKGYKVFVRSLSLLNWSKRTGAFVRGVHD